MPPPTKTPMGAPAAADSEALLRALLEHGPSLVFAIDEAFRIQSINRVPAGLKPEEVLGTSCLDYVPPEFHATVRQAVEQVLRTGKPARYETIARGPTDSQAWYLTHVLPLEQGTGTARLVLVSDDITARQRAADALRESEERQRLALEATSEAVWDWNLDTDECYFSPAYYAMLGLPPEKRAVPKDRWASDLHPDDRDEIPQRARSLLHEPGRYTLRFRRRTASGAHLWIESHGKTVQRGADGRPLRAVGTHLDITERVRLEEALRRSEAQLRALVEGTTDSIFIKDLQGRYLLVNKPALREGRSVADTLGRDDSAWLPAEAARAIMAIDRQVMTEGKVVTLEETFERVDGHARTFLTTKGPLRDPDGTVVGLFGIARDITELLRKEEAQRQALQDSRDLLEQALANAELGTWDIDLTTGTARYDERYCAMLGVGRGELAPTIQAWLERIHPDDRAAVDDAVRAHDRGETRLYETEHRLRHRGGHWVWVLARGKVLRDAQGHSLRAVGTHQDITDRKRVATEGAVLLKKIEALIGGLSSRRAGELSPADLPAGRAPLPVPLSGRHREVLELLASGLTAAEIAQRLGISKETANTHRRNLMRKLGLRNKAELIRYAIRHGIEPRASAPDAR